MNYETSKFNILYVQHFLRSFPGKIIFRTPQPDHVFKDVSHYSFILLRGVRNLLLFPRFSQMKEFQICTCI